MHRNIQTDRQTIFNLNKFPIIKNQSSGSKNLIRYIILSKKTIHLIRIVHPKNSSQKMNNDQHNLIKSSEKSNNNNGNNPFKYKNLNSKSIPKNKNLKLDEPNDPDQQQQQNDNSQQFDMKLESKSKSESDLSLEKQPPSEQPSKSKLDAKSIKRQIKKYKNPFNRESSFRLCPGNLRGSALMRMQEFQAQYNCKYCKIGNRRVCQFYKKAAFSMIGCYVQSFKLNLRAVADLIQISITTLRLWKKFKQLENVKKKKERKKEREKIQLTRRTPHENTKQKIIN